MTWHSNRIAVPAKKRHRYRERRGCHTEKRCTWSKIMQKKDKLLWNKRNLLNEFVYNLIICECVLLFYDASSIFNLIFVLATRLQQPQCSVYYKRWMWLVQKIWCIWSFWVPFPILLLTSKLGRKRLLLWFLCFILLWKIQIYKTMSLLCRNKASQI